MKLNKLHCRKCIPKKGSRNNHEMQDVNDGTGPGHHHAQHIRTATPQAPKEPNNIIHVINYGPGRADENVYM